MSDEQGTTVWVPDETYEVRKKPTPEEGDDHNPDPFEMLEAREALRHLMRGERYVARVGAPWGITRSQFDERLGCLMWASLAMAGTFAERIAKDNKVTVDEVIDAYKATLPPQGFSTEMSIMPKKQVSTIRHMVRDHTGRVAMTVDET